MIALLTVLALLALLALLVWLALLVLLALLALPALPALRALLALLGESGMDLAREESPGVCCIARPLKKDKKTLISRAHLGNRLRQLGTVSFTIVL